MNERALSQELHRVTDAVLVPDNLYSPELLGRHPRARTRPRWLVAAVAAAALVVFFVSPLGARAVTAAGELITQFAIKLVITDRPRESMPYVGAVSVEPGQTVVHAKPGYPKQVATGMTLKELGPEWPLPTYKAPGQDSRVVRVVTYQEGTDTPMAEGVTVSWTDNGHPIHYNLTRRTDQIPDAELQKLTSGESPAITIYTNDQRETVKQKSVVFKGQPAQAMKVGANWSLYWWHPYGGGSITGMIDLEELLKIAESLPELK